MPGVKNPPGVHDAVTYRQKTGEAEEHDLPNSESGCHICLQPLVFCRWLCACAQALLEGVKFFYKYCPWIRGLFVDAFPNCITKYLEW